MKRRRFEVGIQRVDAGIGPSAEQFGLPITSNNGLFDVLVRNAALLAKRFFAAIDFVQQEEPVLKFVDREIVRQLLKQSADLRFNRRDFRLHPRKLHFGQMLLRCNESLPILSETVCPPAIFLTRQTILSYAPF